MTLGSRWYKTQAEKDKRGIMPVLYMTVGPEECGKTTWIKDFLLVKNKKPIAHIQPKIIGKLKHIDVFAEDVRLRKDIIIDSTNESERQRSKYIDVARSAGYRIVCYVFQHAINTNQQFKASLDKPNSSEFHEIINVARPARILDLRNVIKDQRYVVVGDIHGCLDELLDLMDNLKLDLSKEFLICTGDLVDRGPNSLGTVNFFAKTPNVFSVEGNHDSKFRRWLLGSNVKMTHGIDATIKEFNAAFVENPNVRDESIQYFLSLPQLIRLPDLNGKPQYVVHAGIDADYPMTVQKYEHALYARFLGGKDFFDESGYVWYSKLKGPEIIMCGHIVHENARPNDHVICLDGGAVHGNVLRSVVNGTDIVEIKARQCYHGQVQREDGNYFKRSE